VAVVDFDVHHGNGTQVIFWSEPSLFYGSTHQMPLFPGTGSMSERGETGNIVNAPLKARDGGKEFRQAYESVILPALRLHAPDLIIVSAGFDAHRSDPLGNLNLTEADFAWITRQLTGAARECCEGRVVSLLEGGYDLTALGSSVAAHVQELLEAS
jgi:acetoin utilization deacetylase AcuC-like enzyme